MSGTKSPIRNIKLVIEYDGTNYHGWQVQKGQISIQEVITRAIKKVTNKSVTLCGAGRTDSGVHAVGQVANFFTTSKLPTQTMLRAFNANLPSDIVIKKAVEVPESFHARFRAKKKTYFYTILNAPTRSALRRSSVWFINNKKLEVDLMRKGASFLKGRRDFRAFTSKSTKEDNCVRKIYSLRITRQNSFVYIKITGDGFLYNMVRAIVGTLVQVGRKKILPKEVKKILNSHDRKRASATAPAQGLCLQKIAYE